MNSVVHFEIPASDPDKLSDFYTQLFGWHIDKMDMGGGYIYYMASTTETTPEGMPKNPGAINVGIYARTSESDRPMNYVDVPDIDAFIAKAQGLGSKVLTPKMPIHGMGWYAQLEDPQGNAYGLYQNDPSA
jgi:predicted enzyme related to lactoylglutathione lyase